MSACHIYPHATCIRHITLSSAACLSLPYFSTSFHKQHNGGKNIYLLTPWCRVLLEKLTGLQLVKKFPAFYGNRRFITALTSVRHLSLSWASPIQSTYPHPTSWRSILILSTHLRLGLPRTRCTNFTNLFLEQNSTCFGQFLCPSSGVFHCTHSKPV